MPKIQIITYPPTMTFQFLILIIHQLFNIAGPFNTENHQLIDSSYVIAFGSCNRQDLPQPLWKPIIAENPDLWIWSGDNIYGDSGDTAVLKAKYHQLLANEDYKNLTRKTKIIGTWDDHDYGINDGGKAFAQKELSQQLALDFLGVPKNNERRNRPGIYDAHNFALSGKKAKVILLDSRYHRDTIYRVDGRYEKNLEGDVLGEKQWEWLKDQLEEHADINIIVSSIQVLSSDHNWEKWANLPSAKKRLFELIKSTKAKGVIFISGDRHIAEISKIQLTGVNYPIYDITSSGLTHTWSEYREEKNEYRISPLITQLNYGLLEIRVNGKAIDIKASIKGENSQLYYQLEESY